MPDTDRPIDIPDDIAEKCNEPDQFERFDKVFSEMAENMNPPLANPIPPKKRGRRPKPKK